MSSYFKTCPICKKKMVVHIHGQPLSNTAIPDKVITLLDEMEASHAEECGICRRKPTTSQERSSQMVDADTVQETFIHADHDRQPDKESEEKVKQSQGTFEFC